MLEPPPEGWHDTGDIVTIDAQGFVTIKGRAQALRQDRRRDDLARRGRGARRRAVARRAVRGASPCPMRARASGWSWSRSRRTRRAREFQSFAKRSTASELMIPSEVLVLEKLPLLGSGKVDIVAVAKLVAERAAAAAEPRSRAVG